MEQATAKQRHTALIVFLAIASIFAVVFVLENVVHLDFGRLFNPCGFKQRTQLPCITCGWTTATRAFVRGQWGHAFYLQPAATFINASLMIMGFIALWIGITAKMPVWIKRWLTEIKWWWYLIALLIILCAGWAVTFARAWRG